MHDRSVILVLSTALLLVQSCCNNDEEFDHPLDPGSSAYIPPIQGLIIDDYNDMERIATLPYQNPWGFTDFVFPDPALEDTVVTTAFECSHFDALRWHGCSLIINFDVRRNLHREDGGWGQRLGDSLDYFDAKVLNLTKVTFWVRGAIGGEVFEVGIRDSAGFETNPKYEVSKDLLTATEWQKVTIFLVDLRPGMHQQRGAGIVNFKALENVNIGFNRMRINHQTRLASPQKGTIYIDDLAFER